MQATVYTRSRLLDLGVLDGVLFRRCRDALHVPLTKPIGSLSVPNVLPACHPPNEPMHHIILGSNFFFLFFLSSLCLLSIGV